MLVDAEMGLAGQATDEPAKRKEHVVKANEFIGSAFDGILPSLFSSSYHVILFRFPLLSPRVCASASSAPRASSTQAEKLTPHFLFAKM